MKLTHALLAVTIVVAPSAAFAAAPHRPLHHINQRKVDQQDRIAQGVKSGQLTPGETAKLEHQESGINKEERGMRAEDNGHLTTQDRETLTRQQNVESRRIYTDKHNDKTDPGVAPK
jgi:hypothetical protein